MDSVYLFFLIILFILAISDLIVGVTNDAVNFLNSAVGARAASFKTVMIVASLGVLIGATFSSGLMEIARKGLFFPAMFSFHEVMIIFLAVMITDVILLDLFNTFGLPTSTTVSIVFELLGASVGIAIIKLTGSEQGLQEIGQYINAAKALAIITAILVSVALAFSLGALVQYITRLLFTFNLRYNLKYYAALWGGFAITGILYFIVIKGAKGSSFMSDSTVDYITAHSGTILTISFVGISALLQLLILLFNFNVLKLTVLTGTFALALAFAGNDLVNFIGVPLAGLKAFQVYLANPGVDPHSFLMGALNDDVTIDTWMLLIAGAVMAITLWTSKKARSVIETSVDLSRQSEGSERFNSSILSRNLVRGTRNFASAISGYMPDKAKQWIENRFAPPDEVTLRETPDGAAFDMLRASVNLVVASVLIALGTSLKLPLSTTYVTFMVAMGTSLSDRAWGRESAVYRITGVLSVIGGWFFTALAAFTVSLIAVSLLAFGGLLASIALIALVGFLVYRTHMIHLRRAEERKINDSLDRFDDELNSDNIIHRCSVTFQQVLSDGLSILNDTIMGLVDEDLKMLRNAKSNAESLNLSTKRLKNHISTTLHHLRDDSIDSGHFYVQAIDYLREVNHSLTYIVNPCFEHVDNNHKPLIPSQVDEVSRINGEISLLFKDAIRIIQKKEYQDIEIIEDRQKEILRLIEETRKKQIKRIKNNETGTRNSVLYLNILAEIKNLTLFIDNILKSNRDLLASTQTIVSKPDQE